VDLGEGLNHEQSLAIALLVDFMEARSMILGLHIRFGVERLSGIFPCPRVVWIYRCLQFFWLRREALHKSAKWFLASIFLPHVPLPSF